MAQETELNLRDYWNIFLKRKWIILLSFLVIFFAIFFYTAFQPLLYRAGAVIKVEPPAAYSKIFPENYYWQPFELADYAKQVISLPIIERAAEDLNFITDDTPEEKRTVLISDISAGLSAKELEKTNLISIEMISQDAQKAALIVDKIVEVFKIKNIEQKNQQARNVREFIEGQVEIVSKRLQESEAKLKELTLKGIGREATVIVDKMNELESKKADLLTRYTELHPDVIKIDDQMKSFKGQLKILPPEEFEFSNLKRDVTINENLYNLLRERLQEAQIKESEKVDNIIIISPAVVPNAPFSPNKPGNYLIGIILGLIFGIIAGLLFEHLDTSIGRIEDLEGITKINVIGVIPYYIEKDKEKELRIRNSFFNKTVNHSAKNEKSRNKLIITHKENSLFLEAFRILGANVQVVFGKGDRLKGISILITSSNPLEGKSVISSNLSIIMAQMGYKTVLLDTDLRRASVHKLFGLDKKDKGITDVLTGAIPIDAAIRTTADLLLGAIGQEEILRNPWMDNFNLITAGSTFPNSPYLLNTERMDWFLKTLKERYDVMIMDSSPVLAVSDTSIIVPKVDGVALVYRAGFTSRLALRRAKMQIENVKKNVIRGIVLNNVTPEISMDTYYYYHRGEYYKDKQEPEKSKA